MNIVQSLFNREHGFSKVVNYNFALPRLCVAKEDSWRGIIPSNFSSDFNPEPPIFSAKFANCDGYRHILAIANEDGKIALQDTTKRNYDGEEKSLHAPQCHYNAVFDLEWSPGQMKFVSASGDHTARLWQVDGSEIRMDQVFMGHNRSVKTAAFRRNDSSVFATGGRDGAILIWDTRANLNVDCAPRADNCIYSGHVGGPGTPVSQKKRSRTPKVPTATSSSITGLAFQDENTLVSCGAGDGVIKVWDLRRNYTSYKREPLPKYSLPYAGSSTFKGFTNLIIDEAGARLYANCMDNTIYCYNLFSYDPKPVACYKGLLNSTFYIKSCLSPDGKYLVSGSSDEKAYIWSLDYPEEPLVALSGHTVEVTCVAWGSTHDQPLVTCSDDARHKIWRIGPSELSDEDRQTKYCGVAEYVRKFGSKAIINKAKKFNLSDLDATPRSLKRFVEQNERTPGSMEKVSTKRSFMDMLGVNACIHDSSEEREQKRLKTIESKGRRLFSPCPSSTITSSSSGNVQIARCLTMQLTAIPEESPSTSTSTSLSLVLTSPLSRHQETDINNQENTNEGAVSSCSSTIKPCHSIMPLSERSVEDNQNPVYSSPPTQSSQNIPLNQQVSLSSVIYSPTSNLPNYVLDGDAPHLGIMSPKRKTKDKVDWLTKIRKQKLMSCRGTTIMDKINDERDGHSGTTVSSPRIQSLRNSEGSPRSSPRRRTSHNSSNAHNPERHPPVTMPKTPTSSRRNSETSILRFFTVQRQENITNNFSSQNGNYSNHNSSSNAENSHTNNQSTSASSSAFLSSTYSHTNSSSSPSPSTSSSLSTILVSQSQTPCRAYD